MIATEGKTTEQVLKIALKAAKEHKNRSVVVATTTGATAQIAQRIFTGSGIRLVVVSHSSGFRKVADQEMSAEIAETLKANRVTVVTGTMPFHGMDDQLRKRGFYSTSAAVADALRMLGQGTKVGVEIACMAADAGAIIEGRGVITVAGTGRGADTVLRLKSSCSRRMFDTKVLEVIAKPISW